MKARDKSGQIQSKRFSKEADFIIALNRNENYDHSASDRLVASERHLATGRHTEK
ncbi:hypothetical protein BBC0178_015910 [Bartonella apihabitans]|uniref:Uncharacterized protein n=1 Tax=Bartonella apihabitans TaxID=2750929 RepID=A0A1U9MCN4_9HYPH|nr:hypothetical protein BBC0178_015910 [Bartonella apihabitans]